MPAGRKHEDSKLRVDPVTNPVKLGQTMELLQPKASDALEDEKARMAAIVVALHAMLGAYTGCTKANATECNTYSAHRGDINYDADIAARDANMVAPDQHTEFIAMKKRFNHSISSLDEMYHNCTTDIADCATALAFSTSVNNIMATYENELVQLQPDAMPLSTNLLQRQTAGGDMPPTLLQTTLLHKLLTNAQKEKARREIVFVPSDSWDILDCGWSSGEPSASLYPSDGFTPNCPKIGSISCPCNSLDFDNKNGWPAAVATHLSASLSQLSWTLSLLISHSVKSYKETLIRTRLNTCVASVCSRTTRMHALRSCCRPACVQHVCSHMVT